MAKITLRRAGMQDAQLLFDWRNDPVTRTGSLQSEPLDWEKHLRWLAACLDNSFRALYIVELADEAVGTVRADKTGNEYELSWTVAPEKRGRGLGRELVAALIATLPDGAGYRAIVLENNPASHRIARSLGMEATAVTGGCTTYHGRRAER